MSAEQRPDRLLIDVLDIRIRALLNERPFHSTDSIAESLCPFTEYENPPFGLDRE
jgi:hypothetical protein